MEFMEDFLISREIEGTQMKNRRTSHASFEIPQKMSEINCMENMFSS